MFTKIIIKWTTKIFNLYKLDIFIWVKYFLNKKRNYHESKEAITPTYQLGF